ncbi:uncharacterized protein LOC116917228 [Daphnia magna]|uniref:uncharacterized protein LOC116917228 n=1 Tax=Daphnia magna TaxID=35525 RepID=UPI001E1BA3ED|nr:uncharacterized protein LOC116917228 [Daphnia magna]
MKNWMKYGSIGVCFWSLLLVLVGVSQLTFGAYYISKLPIFKIGSPVWIGFLNVLCAAGLFGLHHKTLGLKDSPWLVADAMESNKRKRGLPNGSIHQSIADLTAPTVQPFHLYWSIFICVITIFINIGNAVICQVGEWQHWITPTERDQLQTNLSVLAVQAHRVTVAQMSLAIIIGIFCTALNIWLAYTQRKSNKDPAIETGQSIQSNRTVTIDQAASGASTASAGSTQQRQGKISLRGISPAGYDNPNWVYGENGSSNSSGSQGVLLNPEPENSRQRPVSVSIISDSGGGGSTTRYATIRRAPSILMALPPELHHQQNFPPPRPIHLKSASFRFGGERDPVVQRQSRAAAKVSRSKTMRETTFMTSPPCYNGRPTFETTTQHTFAQRFQSSLDGNSALSFVHDTTAEEEEEATGGISVASTAPVADYPLAVDSPRPKAPIRSTKVENGMQTTVEADVMQHGEDDDEDDEEDEETPPARLSAVRHQVRSSDRIILRVESFRTLQTNPSRTSTPSASSGQRPHPVRNNSNVKRVSSSTQTDLSVLKTSSSGFNSPDGQGQQRVKRSVLQPHGQQYPVSNAKVKQGGGVLSTSQASTETATMPQISPVESSSGYSSPRGTESKSPTPEPTLGSGQQDQQEPALATSTPAPANVTVIQIDPKPVISSNNKKNKEFHPRVTDVTYAIPRKRSERGTPTGQNESTSTTPDQSFQVSIQSKPVSRSVSFHHLSQAGRKAVYGNEWLNASSLLGNHLPPLAVMSIPRPALRSSSHQRYSSPSGTTRRASSSSSNINSGASQHLPPSGSSLSRSTSMYLAMSEIQRKLDLLQVLDTRHHLSVPSALNSDVVPVHRESQYVNHSYDDFYSASPSHHSEGGSRRMRSRSNSSSRQQPAPQPPPPPPPPPPPLPSVDLNDSLDSAKTLAYLSELEMLARHWRTQLLYKVELKSPSKRMGTVLENDSFQC